MLVALASCDKNSNSIMPNPNTDPGQVKDDNISENGQIIYTGRIALDEGPHDLLISGRNMYATRDRDITLFSLSDPERPSAVKKYSYTSNLGQPFIVSGTIYVAAPAEGALLELDENLNFKKKHLLGIAGFKSNVGMKSSDGDFWIGGSNGTVAILAHYKMVSGSLSLQSSWMATSSNSMIQSIVEQGSHIVVSVASGQLWAFSKASLSAGPVKVLTYDEEPGHEKWGYTICKVGNKAYWANWGAGLATVDLSNPANLKVLQLITNSSMKGQFPDSEGTNVYDVEYNSTHNVLCVANGWSGVLLVRPYNSNKVMDYLDLQYIQNRCIATSGNYIYTGNISGGMSGDLKGIMIYKIKL